MLKLISSFQLYNYHWKRNSRCSVNQIFSFWNCLCFIDKFHHFTLEIMLSIVFWKPIQLDMCIIMQTSYIEPMFFNAVLMMDKRRRRWHIIKTALGWLIVLSVVPGRIHKVYHGMLEGRGGSKGFTMVCWKARADPEGLPWYVDRQGWIQRVYHGMLEGRGGSSAFFHGMLIGRGGSRGFSMVCWKVGVDPEGFSWYVDRQGWIQRVFPWYVRRQGWIQRVYHDMLEGRGGSIEFTMICWKAGVDLQGFTWYAERQGPNLVVFMVCRKA